MRTRFIAGLVLLLAALASSVAHAQTLEPEWRFSLSNTGGRLESLLGLSASERWALPLDFGGQLDVFGSVSVELRDGFATLLRGHPLSFNQVGGQLALSWRAPAAVQLAPGLSLEGVSAGGAWEALFDATGQRLSALLINPLSLNFNLRIGAVPVQVGVRAYLDGQPQACSLSRAREMTPVELRACLAPEAR